MKFTIIKNKSLILFFTISFLISTINSAGIFDYTHSEDSPLTIQVGKLTSKKQIIPYSYTFLKICNAKKATTSEDTLGEILTGTEHYITEYSVNTNKNKYCEILCSHQLSNKLLKRYQFLIKGKYVMNWFLDKLPSGLMSYDEINNKTSIDYFNRIPFGYQKNDKFYIYNHLHFNILLNKKKDEKFEVVGFNILPMSIKHNNNTASCEKSDIKNVLLKNSIAEPQLLQEETPILFTYDTVFEYSNITMASRWDHYKLSKKEIHWTGIFISNLIIFFLTMLIIFILTKSVKKDIDNYNYQIINAEQIIDHNGWKQIAGDVFRPPRKNRMLLSSIIGTGVQLSLMLGIVLFLGVLGFMNPEKRSNILNIGILLFCLMGFPGGFVAAYFYKINGGINWLKMSLLTSIFFPGTLFFGYIIVDIILLIENSNAAVRFFDIFSLFCLWIFCTMPLILIGSFLGIKSKKLKLPCKINAVPTIIPKKPWYLRYRYLCLLTGLISFLTIIFELNFVMAALWKQQIYYIATFLWISFYFFIFVSGEISIIVVYWNLCWGDYNWWWKSFLIGSSPVIYFVGYSMYYFVYLGITRLSSVIVYFGIMGLISVIAMFVSGSISVMVCFSFIRRIYSEIKID